MERGIKYIGFAESTGYGISGAALYKALQCASIPTHYCGILSGNTSTGGTLITDDINTGYDSVILHTVPEYYPYWLTKEKAANDHVRVWAYTTWETDVIPSHWKDLLNAMDGILVPCTWNKEVFRRCGVTVPVEVIPHISQYQGMRADNEMDAPLKKVLEGVEDAFIFYCIGAWSERKAPGLLIRAFAEEFSSDENVKLILKTSETDWTSYKRKWRHFFRPRFGHTKEAFKRETGRYRKANISHIPDHISDDSIRALHLRGDCFISLTRGEGWGMGAYEAAWYGKPVITTGYGGVLDFLSNEDAFLVDYQLVPVKTGFGKRSYSSNQRWAQADIVHARKMMRFVVEHAAITKEKGSVLKNRVSASFNTYSIVNKLLDILYGQDS